MNVNAKIQTEDPSELEQQFLLRLPKAEAEQIREILKAKPKKLKKNLKLEFAKENERKATVFVKNKPLKATLVDLPCIIESNKAIDKGTLYKTGDISQMLLCEDNSVGEDNKYLYPHGVTPPMRNVRQRRFRKNHQKEIKEVLDVQEQVESLLIADSKAVSTRFEIVECHSNNDNEEGVTEEKLFGACSSSDSEVVDKSAFKHLKQRKKKSYN